MDTGATYDCVNLTFPVLILEVGSLMITMDITEAMVLRVVVIDFQMTPFGLVFLLGLLLPYIPEQTQTLLYHLTIYQCQMEL